MRLEYNTNQISFNGILLSQYGEKFAGKVRNYLVNNGYTCSGKKTYLINHTINDKIAKTNYIRQKYNFMKNEFGFVFFPWSQETYIISKPLYEQKLLNLVKQVDFDAKINLAI